MTEAHISLHFMFTTVHPPEYEFVAARGLKKKQFHFYRNGNLLLSNVKTVEVLQHARLWATTINTKRSQGKLLSPTLNKLRFKWLWPNPTELLEV